MILLESTVVKPTIFPDGTTQVWKLPEELLASIYKLNECTITWEVEFENRNTLGERVLAASSYDNTPNPDAEFMQLAQLKCLVDRYAKWVHLRMPYLPYGRQDKLVGNDATFALRPFIHLLNGLGFNTVEVLDAHNNVRANEILGLNDLSPKQHIEDARDAVKADLILFPDAGAKARYEAYNFCRRTAFATKVRNQKTGVIESIKIDGDLKGRTVLMVDDICDGGRTFIEIAKFFQGNAKGPKSMHLYVTHGIFSRGLQPLRDAGIDRIFTRKGEIK